MKILSDFVVLLELNGNPSYPCQTATWYEVMHITDRVQRPKSISPLVPGRFGSVATYITGIFICWVSFSVLESCRILQICGGICALQSPVR